MVKKFCAAYRTHRKFASVRACAWLLGWALIICTALMPVHASSSAEAGLPFIHNFSAAEYGGAPQNWSVIQDHDGVIYVGNVNDGVFAFDGSRWQRIPIPNRSTVRSMAIDASGRVFVGAVGEFGYLQADTTGRMRYVSLLDKIPADQRQFTDVWKTLAGKDGIYFNTRSYIFRFANGSISAWKADTGFQLAFLVNDNVYVRQLDVGLMRLTDTGLVLVQGGERFADEGIYVLLPWKAPDARPGELLIGTRNDGWWLFDGESYRRWSAAADAAISKINLYAGIWLSNGHLAIAGIPNGVQILDQSGHFVHQLNRDAGLASNNVNGLFEDREHGLWMVSDVGVSHVPITRPLTMFGERNGLAGAVLTTNRYEGILYAGTSEGLFQLVQTQTGGARFSAVTAVGGGTWALLDSGHGLLAAAVGGLYTINNGHARMLRAGEPYPLSLYRSRSDPARIFMGFQSGMTSMRWDGDEWIDEGRIGDFDDGVRSIVEDDHGELWLGTWNSNVLHVTQPLAKHADGSSAAQVDRFNAEKGVSGGEVTVAMVNGQLRVGTSTGVVAFNPQTGRFSPDPAFAGSFAMRGQQTAVMKQDDAGKLWMYVEDLNRGVRQTGAAVQVESGKWEWTASPLQPLMGINMLSIRPEPDGVVWFSAEQGLYRYAPHADEGAPVAFATLLRSVTTIDGAHLSLVSKTPAQLPSRNVLRFEFAAPSFERLDASRFQTKLVGLDEQWSTWSGEAYRDYMNIPAGDYRFQVRARNLYGELGAIAAFDFTVLPPWYATWWAWLLWIVLAALVLALLVFWRSTALRKRNHTLSAMVHLRTRELEAANKALSEQSTTDPLTGLKNRRYLDEQIQHDVAIAERQRRNARDGKAGTNTDVTFLMIDIDHFKQVNDTHGHAAGDRVLQHMRDILTTAARDSDTPIRWGGEEFLILARATKPRSGALLAERLRSMVEQHPFELGNGTIIRLTCSIGFASYPFFAEQPTALNWEQVVNIADACMYAAKRRGRNGWVGAQAGEVMPQNVMAALTEALERAPEPGPLNVLLSSVADVECGVGV